MTAHKLSPAIRTHPTFFHTHDDDDDDNNNR